MPRRPGWRVALAAATVSLIAAAPLVAAEPAFAQYPPAPGIEIPDDTVAPGDPLTFTATGFTGGEPVDASLVPVAGGAAGASAPTAVLRTSPASVPSVRTFTATTPLGDEGGGTVDLGTFYADGNGVVTGTATIPERIRPGIYLFTLVGRSSDLRLTARVTVERDGYGHGHNHGHGHGHDWPSGDRHEGNGGSPDSGRGHEPAKLADTGSSNAQVALLSAAGGVLLLSGGTLVIARRRRSDAQRG